MEFIKIIIIVILFLGTINLLSTFFMYKKLFGIRIKYNEESTNEINLKKRGVTFYSGVNRLQGYFYFRDTEIDLDKEVVLIVHGYGATHRDYILEIESFIQKNYLVFAYDMTGCGESEGKSLKGFGQFILDAKAALEYLESLNIKNKVILYGHSTGAFAVAALLSYVDKKQVSHAVVISAFSYSPVFVRMTMQKYLKIFAYPMQLWIYCFERVKFGKIAISKGIDGINNFLKTVVIVQGENDTMVSYKSSLYVLKKYITNRNADYILVEKAKHNPIRERINGKTVINQKVFLEILNSIDK